MQHPALAGAASSGRGGRPRRRLAPVVVATLVALAGCADLEDGGGPGDARAATDSGARGPCPAQSVRPDGGCCAPGHVYVYAADACRAFGPPACAGSLLTDPAACTPRWCPQGGGDHGGVGRACTPQELAEGGGCPAGQHRSDGEACVAAGSTAPPGPAPDAPLPPLHETRVCPPDDPAACVHVGVPWLCPPGFVEVPSETTGTLARCAPDPALCGDDPFGGFKSAPDRVFLLAGAPPGGDGTREAPLTSILAATLKVPTGGTLVVGAGTYPGDLFAIRSFTVVGRCAAMVHIVADKSNYEGIDAYTTGGAVKTRLVVRDVSVTSAHAAVGTTTANIHLERVHIVSAGSGAVRVASNGRVTLKDVYVARARLLAADDGSGGALSANEGGYLSAENVRIRDFEGAGVAVVGAGSAFEAHGLLIDGSAPVTDGGGPSNGMYVAGGGRILLSGARIHAARRVGIGAHGKGSRLDATGVLVDATRPLTPTHGSGFGIQVHGRATASVRACRVHAARVAGVLVDGEASELELRDTLIDATLPAPVTATDGRGLSVNSGAVVKLGDVRVSGNRTAGIAVHGKGAELHATGLVVDGTLPRLSDGAAGVGLHATGGATVALAGARFHGNRSAGLSVAGIGTRLSATELRVTHTDAAEAQPAVGYGLQAADGAEVRIDGGSLLDNLGVGMAVGGAGTDVVATGMRVARTRPLPAPLAPHGTGIEVGGGARLSLVGSVIVANHLAGAAVLPPQQSRLALIGVVVTDTRVDPTSASFGLGVFANGGTLDLRASRIAANRAVGAQLIGATATIADTAIVATLPAPYRELDAAGERIGAPHAVADGLVADAPSKLSLARTLIVGTQAGGRVGVLLAGSGQLAPAGLAVTAHRYGLVGQHGATIKTGDVLLWGNEQSRRAGAEVYVPTPPDIVPL